MVRITVVAVLSMAVGAAASYFFVRESVSSDAVLGSEDASEPRESPNLPDWSGVWLMQGGTVFDRATWTGFWVATVAC